MHLPHLKGQDNFGGLLSADRLKAFASIDGQRDDSGEWNDNFDGELMTIKGLQHWAEPEPQEQTIRPLPKKLDRTLEQKAQQGHRRQRSRVQAHHILAVVEITREGTVSDQVRAATSS